jgi:hypothetical protein
VTTGQTGLATENYSGSPESEAFFDDLTIVTAFLENNIDTCLCTRFA